MPTYEVTTPSGTFQVDSPNELSDDEIKSQLQSYQAPAQQPPQGEQLPAPSYSEVVGRRVKEAGTAAINAPANLLNLVTGGSASIVGENNPAESVFQGYPRIAAALKLGQAAASPFSILLSPVEAAGEKIASGVGANEAWSKLAGDITGAVGTLGLGLLAKAGKLGVYGEQLAKVMGVGRTSGTLEEQLAHDPQLRFALGRDVKETTNPLEELARTSASMEDLALSLKSPELARNFLEQRKVKTEIWGEWAKTNQIIDEVPEPAAYSPSQIVEFQPPPSKATLFSTLGTPTNVIPRINPQAAPGAYEVALTEMNLKEAVISREARNAKALLGISDNDVQKAIVARESLTQEQIVSHRGLNQQIKGLNSFLEDKFQVDKGIILPRLRDYYKDKFLAQYTKEAERAGTVVVDGTLEMRALERANELVPDTWGFDKYIPHIFPGEYKITQNGRVVANAKSSLEAEFAIRDLAIDQGSSFKASEIAVAHKTIFESDVLAQYKGRVGRTVDNIAKGGDFDQARITAASEGDIGKVGQTKFWGALLPRGNAKGYSKDLALILQTYDRGFERFMQLTDMTKKVQPVVNELKATNQNILADMLEHSVQRVWGYPKAVSQYFDNTLQAIPGVRNVVAPQALERWLGGLKTGITASFLLTSGRYHVQNALQTLSTLWPIIRGGDYGEGLKLLNSAAGKVLLETHNVVAAGGKLETLAGRQGPIEAFNQNLAFLTMYNKARKLGLSDTQAGIYGKTRGNLYTQFTALTSDVPYAFSKVDPMGIMTMFQRYPVKNLELVLDAIKDKNFPAAAKFMGVTLALGGFRAAAFGQGGWLTYKLYKQIEADYGTPAADLVHSGLPGLIGVDMSNSVMLYNPPFGKNWAEKAGNLAGGVVGSLASSALGAMAATAAPEPEATQRVFNAMIDRIPALRQLDALRRIYTQDYDFKDPLGRLRYKGDVKDAIKQLMGARPLKAGLDETYAAALMSVEEQRREVIDYAASRYGQAQLAGIDLGSEMQKAVEQEVNNWNTLWPEFPVTGSEISTRAQRRAQVATQTLRERLLRGAPAAVRRSGVFQPSTIPLIPGGE